jgi:hypothetical protein
VSNSGEGIKGFAELFMPRTSNGGKEDRKQRKKVNDVNRVIE